MRQTGIIKTVYISNISEDVWPFIAEISNPQDREYEIQENARLCDRELLSFSGADNMLMILPSETDADFLKYYYHLFGNQNFRIILPRIHTGEICRDIINSPKLMEELLSLSRQSGSLDLIPYSTSWQFLELVSLLRQKGAVINTPESPDAENSWTVNFYGSKSGIRQLAQAGRSEEPDLKMGDGLITTGINDAAKIAANFYLKNHGVVLKTNKGHAGIGLLIFKNGDLPEDFPACQEKIRSVLKQENYWGKFPIIVEEYISAQSTIGGGFPNVEFKITRSGRINFLYSCGMRINKSNFFRGIEINKEVLPERINTRLMDTGFYIAEKLASEGYAGYFDVDFVASKSGDYLVTESNVRRTGGTHVYHTAVSLFGEDFNIKTYTLSNNLHDLPENGRYKFREIHQLLQPILYDKKRGEGLILASANVLALNKLAYIIFGNSEKRAAEIEAKMESLISTLGHR